MSRVGYYGGYGEWAPYVSVAKRRREAASTVAKLRKKDKTIAPVTIEGSRIATSFWGKAWCDNLESYRDYAYRLERGRSYVRHGAVVDLKIAPGEIAALVNGSELYRIKVTVAPTPPATWRAICADCTGRIESLVELLQGRFSKPVMERLCSQDSGLFPRPSEIRFTCSCPDHASMCKHVAAVLYGIGARLDHSPELLFRLRAVDETALLADFGAALPGSLTGPDAAKTLAGDDLGALFGLDMVDGGEDSAAPAAPSLPRVARPASRKVAGKGKGTAAKSASATSAPAPAKPVQKINAKTAAQTPVTTQAKIPVTTKAKTQVTARAKTEPAPAKATQPTPAAKTKTNAKPAAAARPTSVVRKAPTKSTALTQPTAVARRQPAAGPEAQPTPVRATAARGRAGRRQASLTAKRVA
jgi:uncharacterized Zn finger protein